MSDTPSSLPEGNNDKGRRFIAMVVDRILLGLYEAVVVLCNESTGRSLHIWMAKYDAASIAAPLGNIRFRQPLCHDMIADALRKMDIAVESAEVSDLRDNTYFASLRLKGPSGTIILDARPCDAIAIAVRAGAPIRVAEDVLARQPEADLSGYDDISDDSEDADKWLRFLEGLDDEDLGEYEA